MKGSLCFLLWPLALVILTGCSKAEWSGRVSLFRAEQLFWKTHVQMKSQRVSFKDRQPHYSKACELYIEALRLSPKLFNSPRLEEAGLTCTNAENRQGAHLIDDFYEAYCRVHPLECEYGDMPMGGFEEY